MNQIDFASFETDDIDEFIVHFEKPDEPDEVELEEDPIDEELEPEPVKQEPKEVQKRPTPTQPSRPEPRVLEITEENLPTSWRRIISLDRQKLESQNEIRLRSIFQTCA